MRRRSGEGGELTVVSFDLWHTLLYLEPEDEERYYRGQVATAVEALAQAPSRGDGRRSFRPGLQRAFERVLRGAVAAAGVGRTITPVQQLRNAGALTGRTPDLGRYRAALRHLVQHQPFRLAPGALGALDRLLDEGRTLLVISNTVGEEGAFLAPVLRRTGLRDRIPEFVFSDQHPWAKPDPEIFRYALARVGGVPSQTVHVGDSYSDVEGARRAGLRGSVWYTGLQAYGHHYRELHTFPGRVISTAVPRVTSLTEVPSAVARLFDRSSARLGRGRRRDRTAGGRRQKSPPSRTR